MKRIFDLIVSALILLLLMPLFIVIAILIKIDSPGPVFFKQKRIGLNGQPFWMYKFRSMDTQAEKKGPYYTQENDPRITKTGHFIRKTSIDELPQLINVIKGDMSLVGPRPDVPAQQKDYTPQDWQKRLSVLPGITGLAQAVKRSSATGSQRLDFDLEYVDRASFLMDLKIILLTVKQVLVRKGTN